MARQDGEFEYHPGNREKQIKQTVREKSFDLVRQLGHFDQLQGCHDD